MSTDQDVTPEAPPSETVREDNKRLKVGQCPACSGYLWADVVTQTFTRAPRWTDDNRPHSTASTLVVASTVEHACDARQDATSGGDA